MMILPRRGSDRVTDSVVLVILVVAASLGTVLAKDTAFVEVVLFESSPNGDYTTYTTGLQGRFSKAGATISAEGEIVQRDEARREYTSASDFQRGLRCRRVSEELRQGRGRGTETTRWNS
ncbi:hypothetical protein PAMP_021878 [Pampus punctatissimus]